MKEVDPRRAPREGGGSRGQEGGGSFGCANPVGSGRGCWAGDWVLGRGLGVGEDQRASVSFLRFGVAED